MNKCYYCGREMRTEDLIEDETLDGKPIVACRNASDCLLTVLAEDGFYKRHPEMTQ